MVCKKNNGSICTRSRLLPYSLPTVPFIHHTRIAAICTSYTTYDPLFVVNNSLNTTVEDDATSDSLSELTGVI